MEQLVKYVELENNQLVMREDFLKPAQDKAKSDLEFDGDRCQYYIERIMFDMKQGLTKIIPDPEILKFQNKFAFFSDQDY